MEGEVEVYTEGEFETHTEAYMVGRVTRRPTWRRGYRKVDG